jgi:predicted phage tail protein
LRNSDHQQSKGLTYAVFKDKKNIGKDDFGFPVTGEVIRIVPVVMEVKSWGITDTLAPCSSLLG